MQSMTGFAKVEKISKKYGVNIEIKSVNHRFRDLRFKMSSHFSAIEIDLRKEIEKNFKRGSFDIYINYSKQDKNEQFAELDFEKINRFIQDINKGITITDKHISINPCDFLRGEFYKDDVSSRYDDLKPEVVATFLDAVSVLKNNREEEGKKIKNAIIDLKNKYEIHYKDILSKSSLVKKIIKERLEKKLKDLMESVALDETRMAQEIIYYLEKSDIQEEIDRIAMHLQKFDKVLNDAKEAGREIDFILQELNRETNTIGSKTGQDEISEHVIQMKVLLENIREQALNLE